MSDSESLISEDLRLSPLPLTQKHRDELDAAVLEQVEDLLDHDSDSICISILLQTVHYANQLLERENMKDILDTKMACRRTVQQHPKLRDIVRAACQSRKFSSIADLEIFRISYPANPQAHSAQDEVKDDRLYGSFVRPYVGEAVDSFFDYLTSNNKKFSEALLRPYYGKFCSIVQSSGSGKSRLLTELRKKNVLVLYMNIRDPSDSGFPARDKVPSNILTDEMQCSQAEYTARCCAFFAAIFTTLERELSELMPSRLRSGRSDIPGVKKTWNDRMCDMRSADRTKFFDKVKDNYLAVRRSAIMTTDNTISPDIVYSLQILPGIDVGKKSKQVKIDENALAVEDTAAKLGNMTLGGAKIPQSEAPTKIPRLEGESALNGAYRSMLAVLPQLFPDSHEPQLVIAFDEAHSLSEKSSEGFRPSHILCRAINAYSRTAKGSIWVVFASTTSQVAAFSAPQPIHDSLRVAVTGQLLFPPYTHLGWDQNADALSDVSANDIAQFDHIAGFGRPLWKSLISVEDETINSIMTTASQKLSKSEIFDATIANEALAVLSQRFALDVCFGHPDAVTYIEKGVASHMRTCLSTTEDRTWSFTSYPSEPLLSCAAANLLHQHPDNLAQALDILKKKVDRGMFEVGQSGELTSRLVLLLAKDKYVRGQHDLSRGPYIRARGGNVENMWKSELIDCQKVSVIHFLKYIFGDSFWRQAGDTAKELFEHAYINFSHWVPMDGLISPGPKVSDRCSASEWTLRHWHRTSAVQCCHLQPLVDKMIPIYFDDLNLGSEDIDRVSQMFISDKAGKNSNERDLGFITRTHPSINCLSPLPFIALLLDLNGESKLDISFAEREPNHPETDRCLRIYACGVRRATFPFLHEYSTKVETLLESFVSKPEAPSSDARLHALVKYGSTVEKSHMRWESGRRHGE